MRIVDNEDGTSTVWPCMPGPERKFTPEEQVQIDWWEKKISDEIDKQIIEDIKKASQ